MNLTPKDLTTLKALHTALAEYPIYCGKMALKGVSYHLAISRQSAKYRVRRLCDLRLAERIGWGTYKLTVKGKRYLQNAVDSAETIG